MRILSFLRIVLIFAIVIVVAIVFIDGKTGDKNKVSEKSKTTYQNQEIIPLDFFSKNSPKKDSIYSRTAMINDDEGRTHLVWTTGGSGIFYTGNEPHGSQWKQPVLLPADETQEDVSAPSLIFFRKQLFLFYGGNLQRLIGSFSEDGKVSWATMSPLLKSGPYEYEYSMAFESVSGTSGIVVGVIVRNNEKLTLDVLSSMDGTNFTRKTVFDGPINRDPNFNPSLLADGNDIHMLWANGGTLYYFHSTDFGKTWTQEKLDTADSVLPGQGIRQFTLLHGNNGKLFAIFSGKLGVYLETKEKQDTRWQDHGAVEAYYPDSLSGISDPPRVFWTDKRFAKTDWRSSFEFLSDQSPDWINNDVFMLDLEKLGTEPIRLTKDLSSTGDTPSVAFDGKHIFLFRFGCAKIYKKSCSAENDLFIHRIDLGGN